MAETNENEGAIQKRSAEQYLTYAKWGLMGIGGLWVAKVAIGLVLNPLVLVGVAGVGAVGWFATKGRKKDRSAAKAEEAPGDTALLREAEAEAEAELAGVPAAATPKTQQPPAPAAAPPSETPLAEFDRRLADLERLKAEMGDG